MNFSDIMGKIIILDCYTEDHGWRDGEGEGEGEGGREEGKLIFKHKGSVVSKKY